MPTYQIDFEYKYTLQVHPISILILNSSYVILTVASEISFCEASQVNFFIKSLFTLDVHLRSEMSGSLEKT